MTQLPAAAKFLLFSLSLIYLPSFIVNYSLKVVTLIFIISIFPPTTPTYKNIFGPIIVPMLPKINRHPGVPSDFMSVESLRESDGMPSMLWPVHGHY